MNITPETITVTVPGETGVSLTIKAFAPRPSDESDAPAGRSAITGGIVYGYRGTEIPQNAILTIRGVDWQMEGEIGDWKSPYHDGDPDGVEFAVRRAS